MPLSTRTAWIFDMDGTLTESLHDFPAISRALGLPPNEPILDSVFTKHLVQPIAPKAFEELTLYERIKRYQASVNIDTVIY